MYNFPVVKTARPRLTVTYIFNSSDYHTVLIIHRANNFHTLECFKYLNMCTGRKHRNHGFVKYLYMTTNDLISRLRIILEITYFNRRYVYVDIIRPKIAFPRYHTYHSLASNIIFRDTLQIQSQEWISPHVSNLDDTIKCGDTNLGAIYVCIWQFHRVVALSVWRLQLISVEECVINVTLLHLAPTFLQIMPWMGGLPSTLRVQHTKLRNKTPKRYTFITCTVYIYVLFI